MAFAAAVQILLAAAALSPPSDYLPTVIAQARTAGLAESRPWQTLVHYRRRAFGGWQSEADGAGFFLAGPRGRRDPAAELEASLAAFLAPGPAGDEHAQCRFPARWEWLKQALRIDPARAPDVSCPALHQWFTGISPQAATLIYATAYINSPASIYGHTFLRVSRSTGEGNPLLDYAINFAADVDTENGLLYAVKGVFGLFPGRFYVMPYYVKVQEYSNMESRDLWEYELSLSPEQVRRLVLHAWETRTTHFNYYFFSRNCSYQLLSLIEAAAPELHLVDGFGPAVIPSDTVRAILAHPGLVRAERPRPSLLSVLRRRRVGLSSRELRIAEAWATAPDGATLPPFPPGSKAHQAQILDAAYDYLRYREGLKAEPSEGFKKRERRLLLARGRLGVPPQDPVVVPDVGAPERGHATARVSLGGGTSDQAGPFQTLSIRGAIHDTLDPPGGYPVDARLEMGDLRLRFQDRQRALQLDRLDLIDIVSSAPLDRWVRGVSWKVWIGVDNARELGCMRPDSPENGWRCLYAGLTTGGGLATRFGPRRRLLLLALAETDFGAGPAFSAGHDFRLGAGGELMLAGGAGDRWRFEAGGRLILYFLGERTPNLRARFAEAVMLSRHLALRAAVETANAYAQATGEVLVYF
ncbi:MAG TPA: DUF4105 domain-containing protein [Polyangia bacterium]|nr:DUF4105 domain-containing protein [Polyangia bacterium]